MMNARARNTKKIVPFLVLHLSCDKVKAVFIVQSRMAGTLINHPILCRGACFDLRIDVESQSREESAVQQNGDKSFLSTEFSSPDPEETARAIAERIAIRQENPLSCVSNIFGWEVQGSLTYWVAVVRYIKTSVYQHIIEKESAKEWEFALTSGSWVAKSLDAWCLCRFLLPS